MSAPTVSPNIASTPGGMARTTPAYRAGWEFAEQQLADEPREVREAAARNMAEQQRGLAHNSPESLALAGGLAYLTHRHEG